MVSAQDCFAYTHQRPALTADWVALAERDGRRCVLLIKRRVPPFVGAWALPGGHVEPGETIEEGALRELVEETGLVVASGRQVGAFGDPGRDPRGWVVSVAFAVSVDAGAAATVVAGDDAADVGWFPLDALPPLAFDHDRIIKTALEAIA